MHKMKPTEQIFKICEAIPGDLICSPKKDKLPNKYLVEYVTFFKFLNILGNMMHTLTNKYFQNRYCPCLVAI